MSSQNIVLYCTPILMSKSACLGSGKEGGNSASISQGSSDNLGRKKDYCQWSVMNSLL